MGALMPEFEVGDVIRNKSGAVWRYKGDGVYECLERGDTVFDIKAGMLRETGPDGNNTEADWFNNYWEIADDFEYWVEKVRLNEQLNSTDK